MILEVSRTLNFRQNIGNKFESSVILEVSRTVYGLAVVMIQFESSVILESERQLTTSLT